MSNQAFAAEVEKALRELDETRAIDRLFARDGALWSSDPTVRSSIVKRLGWLTCVPTMTAQIGRLVNLARTAERRGFDRCLVVGMGGSSLWPEVIARHLSGHRGLTLRVADSVHPAAIKESIAWAEKGQCLFLIATKSGGTVETLSLYRVLRAHFDDGSRFVAITDPHSGLARLAADEGFWEVFLNPADIGGRFSAGSLFGLVPAALSGVVIKDALATIDDMLATCRMTPAKDNPGAELAAFLAAGQRTGRWHLRLAFGKDVRGFAAWVEQLVAESTGKHATGILPVPGTFTVSDETEAALAHSLVASLSTFMEPDEEFALEAEDVGTPTRSTVMPVASDLWAEVVRWEIATALCGALLGINPFDEPDVSSAKAATKGILDESVQAAAPDTTREARKLAEIAGIFRSDLGQLDASDYVAVLLYLAPTSANRQRALGLRESLQAKTTAAVTVQFGPRYLHSTGQLHKGGPTNGRFIVVHDLDGVAESGPDDVTIPGGDLTARKLLWAQLQGDVTVLKERDKRVDLVSLRA